MSLAAALPNTGSYSSFSIGGQSHTFGQSQEHGKAPVVHGHSEPLYYAGAKPIHHEPAPYHPEPAPYHPKPAPYHPKPAAYRPEPAPYHPKPAPYSPEPAYYPKPAPYHPEPAYHPKPAPYHPKPAYGGYEQPKHNCSIEDVVEVAEVCTPTFETKCSNVELAIKRIVDGEYCYDVSRTVCSESTEVIDNEVCSYSYDKKYEDTTAKTVEVSFKKESNTQMVTVCQPGYGHGYQQYGHQYCKEVEQETSYNVPVVAPREVEVRVGYPEPIKTCVNKPISLPRISCEDLTENKCITVPEVETVTESVDKCVAGLGAPDCQAVELTLPKQVCKEINYGHSLEVEPAYAAAAPAEAY